MAGAPEDIEALVSGDILREAEASVFSVHDLVRDAVLRGVPPDRVSEVHAIAAGYFARHREPQAVLHAIRHFLKAGEQQKAAELLIEAAETLVRGGLAAPLGGIAEGLARAAGPETRTELLTIEGSVSEFTGEWDRAIRFYRKAVAEGTPARPVAIAQLGLGRLLRFRDLRSESLDLLGKAREAFERIGDPDRLSEALYHMGRLVLDARKFEAAQALLEESRAVAFSQGNRIREGLAVYGLGVVADDQRQYGRAAQIQAEALEILERTGSIIDLAKVLTGYAGVLQALGRFDEALTIQHRATNMARRTGDLYALSAALANAAVILNRAGRPAEALEPAMESLRLEELPGNVAGTFLTRPLLGRLLFKLGDTEGARREWERAGREIESAKLEAHRAEQLRYLGMMCLDSREFTLADRWLAGAARRRRSPDRATSSRGSRGTSSDSRRSGPSYPVVHSAVGDIRDV